MLARLTSAALLLAAAAYAYAAGSPRPATPTELALVKKGMAERLKDADSAKFLDVRVGGKDGTVICGKVNSKNSFGAYAGYTYFYAMLVTQEGKKKPFAAYVIGIDDLEGTAAGQMCEQDLMEGA